MTDPAKDYPDFADLDGMLMWKALPISFQRIMDRIKAIDGKVDALLANRQMDLECLLEAIIRFKAPDPR